MIDVTRQGFNRPAPLVVLAAALALLTGCAGEADVRVLFVGNSLTHGNDVPGLVEDIADDNGVAVDAEMIAPGGAFLADHLANPEVREALAEGDFDVVILQEQSMAPAHAETFRNSTQPSAERLVELARAGGAEVVWYQTWAHLNGNEITGHNGYASMQDDIIDAYDELSWDNGVRVARVGEAFAETFQDQPGLALHHGDGVHSSPAGAYLAALVITAQVAEVPVTIADGHGGVDDGTAARLLLAAG